MHEIFAKIDWCRSTKIEVNANENEIKTLKLSSFKYSTWFFPLIIGLIFIYSLGEYVLNYDFSFLMFFIAIAFLYPIYYITLGKNRYLTLTK